MIPLEPGDEIVSSCNMRDFILVFTRRGYVYRIGWDHEMQTFVVTRA